MLDPPPSAPIVADTRIPVTGLLVLVFLIQFAFMPAFLVEGDAVAVRAITARFLHTGKLSIPVEHTDLLDSFGEHEGQYFFRHPDGDRLYSKYGVLNALIYAPPVWIHRQLTGIEDPFTFSHSLVFLLNLYNILFSVLIAHRLLRIANLYTKRRSTAWIFVLSSLYATFLWYYLRAQGGEIFQVFFFLCVYDYFVRALRGPGRDLAKSLVCVTALVLLKSYYVMLLPVMATVWWFAQPPQPLSQRVRITALTLVIPGTVIVLLVLGIHAWKFGSPLESGYSQFEPEAFTLMPRGEAVLGFLFRPDRSLLLHAPPVLLALIGWRWFARHYRYEALFTFLVSLLVVGLVSCFANWPGHWCYGPRYLLVLAPVLSIPLLCVLDRLRTAWLAVLAILIVSIALQWQVIGKRFLLAYEISGMLREAGVQDTVHLTGSRNFGLLYVECERFARRGVVGPVVRQLREDVPTETASEIENNLRLQLVTNYFWLYPIAPESSQGVPP